MSTTTDTPMTEVFQAVYIPNLKPTASLVPKEMAVSIATYPPLDQVSHVGGTSVVFHAVLDVPKDLAQEPWELALWHSGDREARGAWTEAAFSPSLPAQTPSVLHEADTGLARLFFSLTLPVWSAFSFTVKFRQRPDQPWRWARDEHDIDDGQVTVSQDSDMEDGPVDLPDLIGNLNPELAWASRTSQCPGTSLWSVKAHVGGAIGDTPGSASPSLGVPYAGQYVKEFSLVRSWSPWLVPRQGKRDPTLKLEDAVLCSFLSPQGKHLVLLAVSGLNNIVTVLRKEALGATHLHIQNDGTKAGVGIILVSVGKNFESAVAATMYHARSLVMAGVTVPVMPEWYGNYIDGLGYCTWNGLGQELTADKVAKALDTLAENHINITNLIIDDNWQDIDYRGASQWQHGWMDFEAEPRTFPNGLQALVSGIRSRHQNIRYVAVWHALLGYWGGLAPDGALAQTYRTVEVERTDFAPDSLPVDGKMTVVAKEDVARFYNDFYRFLAEDCGVDGVKTDGQFILDTLKGATPRRELIDSYVDAWMDASLRHFSGNVISCMSQTPHILFQNQLRNDRPAFICRNSDDYFPNDAASHPWHVWSNAHNSLLTHHLNVVPDWDMFQTVHEYAGFHAAARCISGGPIWITDVPGQHDIGLIRQMTGTTTKGKTVIFRPSSIGRTISQYTKYGGLNLLKIGAYHGRAETGSPIMGLFNISTVEVTEIVPLSGFFGLTPSGNYVVRSHVTGKVTAELEPCLCASLLTVTLKTRGYDILSAAPLSTFRNAGGDQLSVANFGLVGKLTGSAAILNSVATEVAGRRVLIVTTLKALGVLGIYISTLPKLSIGDLMVTIRGQAIPFHTGSVSKTDQHVLEIDIETAWNEMGLESGWANEVEVKITIPFQADARRETGTMERVIPNP
ncbi:glycoside hydrolase superfamily [Cercophora scortea]|uniref:Glycoside hydrolase superfamily n=1 Tax=Cercophora scortea TaxID=314031 RepID=A0AAE0J2Y4_9PEZI|nr:glycoside hydrolase superfamily [Cercophora scortea]